MVAVEEIEIALARTETILAIIHIPKCCRDVANRVEQMVLDRFFTSCRGGGDVELCCAGHIIVIISCFYCIVDAFFRQRRVLTARKV